jgi:hypothetical protein
MNVSELLARTSSSELTEWMAFERISGPLGGARADIQAAIVAATIANVQRGKGQRTLAPIDFVPVWDKRKKTPEELWAAAMAANSALGGSTDWAEKRG